MTGFNVEIFSETLKEILREIDSKLTEEDLDGIIEEVDEDGSGTLDFDGTHIKRPYLLILIHFFRIYGNDVRIEPNFHHRQNNSI